MTAAVTVAGAAPDSEQRPLEGRPRRLAQALWIVIAIVVLGLVVTGIPLRYEKVYSIDPNIRDPAFRNLIAAGVPPEVAARCDLAADLVVFLALFGGGSLLFLRGSASREASFLSLALILYGASVSALASVHRTTGPPLSESLPALLTTLIFFLQSSTTFTVLFWLPEGRFALRWTAWLTAAFIAIVGVIYFTVPYPRSHDLVNRIALPGVGIGTWSQIAHYRRIDNRAVRERIKWAVIGIFITSVGFLIREGLGLILADQPGLTARVVMVAAQLLNNTCQIALIGCFAIAIVHYRLWPVDLVINRSLVYGTVSALLAGILLGGGYALQAVLGPDFRSVAFVASTLGAAFFFNPARKWVQHLIDRRLYGFRFDLYELQRAQEHPQRSNESVPIGHRIGPYRILRRLGRGGMGEVFQGERDGLVFAIKVLPEQGGGQDFLKWFERESEVLAAIAHPHIVRFHEASQSGGRHYIVLDFIEGRALSDIINERGRLRLDEVRPIVSDLAEALDYAHGRGLVHRDIKPSNIMIRKSANGLTSEAVLMDFGIAKIDDARTVRTSTGAIGTIGYMAPEQIIAATVVDRRADVYALGVTAYEMLTGEVPFSGSAAQVLFAHLQQRPDDPRLAQPDLPTAASNSIMKCLEKNPDDRFQSAGAFARALSAPPVELQSDFPAHSNLIVPTMGSPGVQR